MRLYNAHSCIPAAATTKKSPPRRFLPKQSDGYDLWKSSNFRQNLRPVQIASYESDVKSYYHQNAETRDLMVTKGPSQSTSPTTTSVTAETEMTPERPRRAYTPSPTKVKLFLEEDMFESLPALQDLDDILARTKTLAGELVVGLSESSSLTTLSTLSTRASIEGALDLHEMQFSWEDLPATVIEKGVAPSSFSATDEYEWPSKNAPRIQERRASPADDITSWPAEQIHDHILHSNEESPTKYYAQEPAPPKATNYAAIRASLRKIGESRTSPVKDLKTADFPAQESKWATHGIKQHSHPSFRQEALQGVINDFYPFESANKTGSPLSFDGTRSLSRQMQDASNAGARQNVFRSTPATNTPAASNLSKRWNEVDGSSPPSHTKKLLFRIRDGPSILSLDRLQVPSPESGEKRIEQIPVQDDPQFVKYFDMLDMGIPLGAVMNRMKMNGYNPTLLGGDISAVPIEKQPQDDPKYVKYFRMIKMGLPAGAVKNAMKMDGHNPSILDGDTSVPLQKQRQDTLPTQALRKDTVRHFRIHWETHNDSRPNTVWAMAKRDPDVVNIEVDQDEVEKLFRSDLKSQPPSTSTRDNEETIAKVIDSKRANNGGVTLARIKLKYGEIARAVENFDQDAITAEQIRGIMNFIPTQAERAALRSYLKEPGCSRNMLCECEKFMVAMIGVKHAKRKLSAIQFMQSFTSCLEDLRRDARLVQKACDEVMCSSRFRKILGIVLSIGNRLNSEGNNGREPARAITLDSLLKLNQAKAFDRQTTFLHFVITNIRRNKASLIHFKDDMPSIFKVEKMQWSLVMLEMQRMEKGIDELRKISLHHSQVQAGLTADDAVPLTRSSMSVNREVELLQTTSVGRFTLDACLRMAVLVSEVDKAKDQVDALYQYFGEVNKSNGQPDAVFHTVCTFGTNFDRALDEVINQEKAKIREMRGVPIVRNATKSFDECEAAQAQQRSSTGMLGVLSDITKNKSKGTLARWRRRKI